jgi:hypothetical protein
MLQNFIINAVDIFVFITLKDVTMTWQKWGSKQALEKHKTSLFLMEVFNIALKCSLQILRTFKCIYCAYGGA